MSHNKELSPGRTRSGKAYIKPSPPGSIAKAQLQADTSNQGVEPTAPDQANGSGSQHPDTPKSNRSGNQNNGQESPDHISIISVKSFSGANNRELDRASQAGTDGFHTPRSDREGVIYDNPKPAERDIVDSTEALLARAQALLDRGKVDPIDQYSMKPAAGSKSNPAVVNDQDTLKALNQIQALPNQGIRPSAAPVYPIDAIVDVAEGGAQQPKSSGKKVPARESAFAVFHPSHPRGCSGCDQVEPLDKVCKEALQQIKRAPRAIDCMQDDPNRPNIKPVPVGEVTRQWVEDQKRFRHKDGEQQVYNPPNLAVGHDKTYQIPGHTSQRTPNMDDFDSNANGYPKQPSGNITGSGKNHDPAALKELTKTVKFSGEGGLSVDEFLETLDMQIRLKVTNPTDIMRYLFVMLQKSAARWFRASNSEVQSDYSVFKEKLRHKFAANMRTTASRSLRHRVQGPNESVADYAESIETLCISANITDPQRKAEFFVEGLRESLREKLFVYGPNIDLETAIDVAKNCEAYKPRNATSSESRKDKHRNRDEVLQVESVKQVSQGSAEPAGQKGKGFSGRPRFQNQGNQNRDSRQSGREDGQRGRGKPFQSRSQPGRPGKQRTPHCYGCNTSGHYMSNCPDSAFCKSCQQLGHVPADCPHQAPQTSQNQGN